MKQYTIKWLVPTEPENLVLSTELKNDSYDLVENEYSYESFDIELETVKLGSWCNVATADDAIKIVQLACKYNDTTLSIIYEGNTLTVGDIVLIEAEYTEVTAQTTVDGIKYATLSRNSYSRRTNHYANKYAPITGYVNGLFTPVGTEAKIHDEDDNLVMTVTLAELTSTGKSIIFTFDPVLKGYDRELAWDYRSYMSFEGGNIGRWVLPQLQEVLTDMLYGVVEFQDGFWEGLPDITIANRDIQVSKLNPYEILMEVMKLRNGYIQLKDGMQQVNFIAITTEFNKSTTLTSIYSYMDINGGYESKLASTTTQVNAKWDDFDESYEVEINSVVGNNTSAGEKIEIDIDISEPYQINDNTVDVMSLLRSVAGLRGVVFGYLKIVVIPTHTYEVGQRYKISEIEDVNKKDFTYFIPSRIDTVALCYSANALEAKFIIIENVVKNPISPALKVIATDTNVVEVVGYVNDVYGGLYTASEVLQGATNSDYAYTFFENAMDVQLMNLADYSLKGETSITDITDNTVELNNDILVIGDYYILEYSKNSTDNLRLEHLRMKGGII